MSAVGEMLERKDRPAYVRFERVAVEDKVATLRAGFYVGKDVDMAHITPPYSKDVFKIEASQWFVNMKQDVVNGRMPEEWEHKYLDAYKRWQDGQELPPDGTPIRGWGVISPAQQETFIRMNVLTVEDLAGINDEGIRQIGMGAIDLRNKAKAWLSQLNDKGPLTVEIASIKAENAILQGSIESLTRQVQELKQTMKMHAEFPSQGPEAETIGVSDIIEDPRVEESKPRRGNPKWVKKTA